MHVRTDGRTNANLAFRFAWLLKKIGLLSAADVTYLTREGLRKMTEKFDYNDAGHMTWMIHKRRPEWSKPGIMKAFERLAAAELSLGQAMTAAENAALDKENAKTPVAITFDEYRKAEAKQTVITGTMLCVECATHKPKDAMTKHAHGWVCNEHEDAA